MASVTGVADGKVALDDGRALAVPPGLEVLPAEDGGYVVQVVGEERGVRLPAGRGEREWCDAFNLLLVDAWRRRGKPPDDKPVLLRPGA
jgi:hypothetical protein